MRVIGRLCVFALLTACSNQEGAETHPINREFRFSADMTRDGQDESIVLVVRGADIKQPFTWSLTVKDRFDHVLYEKTMDDAELNEFFGEQGYVDACDSYESCKRRYYFEELPREVARCLNEGSDLARPVDANYSVARDYLEKKNVDEEVIAAALTELPVALAGKSSRTICTLHSPVQDEPSLIWISAVGEFIPYYAP